MGMLLNLEKLHQHVKKILIQQHPLLLQEQVEIFLLMGKLLQEISVTLSRVIKLSRKISNKATIILISSSKNSKNQTINAWNIKLK
jgi:tRNA1(Val) A37 N6-methylase TrmN6